MSADAPGAGPRAWLLRHGHAPALAAALALPFLIMVSRTAAEAALGFLALAFALRLLLMRDAAPLAAPWFLAGCAYWGWLVLSTLHAVLALGADPARLASALAWGRFPLATLALAHWVFATPGARRLMLWAIAGAVGFTVLEIHLQFALGAGLTGRGDRLPGYLTGPFNRPRAGIYLMHLLFPVLLVALAWLLARGRWGWPAAALALGAALGALVLAGQRAPLLTGLLAMGAAALLLPRLRVLAALGVAGAGALIAVAAVVAPDTFHRYGVHLPELIARFPETHYGQILARGLAMHAAHPWLGLGAEGFRHLCPDPAYHLGWGGVGDGGGAAICVTHPHNFYLEALTDAGWPGLLLFVAFVALLLAAALRGLLRGPPDPLRVGLVVAVAAAFWPVTSVSAFGGVETAALRCLVSGLALSLSPSRTSRPAR